MELIRVNKQNKDLKKIKQMFLEAFPPEERPPFRMLLGRCGKPFVDFWGVYDGDVLIGMAYVVKNSEIAYLFFLAIHKDVRSKGYGGILLEKLKDEYRDRKLFLALEQLDPQADNYSQRVKRHYFYKRHGLTELPYKVKEGSVTYDMMGIGGIVEPADYKALMEKYLGPIKKHLVDMRLLY